MGLAEASGESEVFNNFSNISSTKFQSQLTPHVLVFIEYSALIFLLYFRFFSILCHQYFILHKEQHCFKTAQTSITMN